VESVEIGLTCCSIPNFAWKPWGETWQDTDCWLSWLKFHLGPSGMT